MTTASTYTVHLATVTEVERLSPTFLRIRFAADSFAGMRSVLPGGESWDARVKLLLPSPGHPVPDLRGAGDGWYAAWMALPVQTRGVVRTYTIADVIESDGPTGRRTEVDVIVVVHLDDGLATGPAVAWAVAARPGDVIGLLGPDPSAGALADEGIEYRPSGAPSVLVAADETAVPAALGIARAMPVDQRGAIVLEVPGPEDELPVGAPAGVAVHWVHRGDSTVGERTRAVVDELVRGLLPPAVESAGDRPAPTVVPEGELLLDDGVIWETERYRQVLAGLGEAPTTAPATTGRGEYYVWVAGESSMVTGIRRHLVRNHGLDRRRIAFMGYWKRGSEPDGPAVT
ncbi:siderophore-interacting protein [Janibacter sp. G56]|uniref:siderophore-interacting protein n=1 Tax=Janibacter sp. G56 TaxID=3418717 RepID=UPI003D0767DF